MALPIRDAFPEDDSLGRMRNHLGLLSSDGMHFYPLILLEVYPHATDLAARLGVQRTQLYAKQVPLKRGSTLRKRVLNLVLASDLAYGLLGKESEKTGNWLFAPNIHLFGDSPFDLICRDEGEAILTFLQERSGLKPGSPF